ncbi:MAG TPA: SDR family NAD(P)-dependent oxidoreductase [Conexibacter sp.]|jgi:3-oxoacyl-[acyl-carrier protein] reductase
MDLGLDGKVAFITGASKGIGAACAALLTTEGCDVAIVARGQEGLDAAAERLRAESSRRVLPIAADMSDSDDVRRAVQRTVAELGRIDIAIPCAGSSPGGLVEQLTDEQWFSSLNLKFMGHVRTCREVLGHMRERGEGTIVLVVGNDGLKPTYWETTAGAANAADINFASAIAEQYGPYGIRVNTVNPGPVNTDRWQGLEQALARDRNTTQETAHDLCVGSIPLGRICEPEEVAYVVAMLASPLASFVNGAHIPIDGAQRKGLIDMPLPTA